MTMTSLFNAIRKTVARHKVRPCPDQGRDCSLCELVAEWKVIEDATRENNSELLPDGVQE